MLTRGGLWNTCRHTHLKQGAFLQFPVAAVVHGSYPTSLASLAQPEHFQEVRALVSSLCTVCSGYTRSSCVMPMAPSQHSNHIVQPVLGDNLHRPNTPWTHHATSLETETICTVPTLHGPTMQPVLGDNLHRPNTPWTHHATSSETETICTVPTLHGPTMQPVWRRRQFAQENVFAVHY